MNILKNVVNKLSQADKKEVNLASQKVELSIKDDFDAAFAAGVRFMEQADKEQKAVNQTYLAAQREFENTIDAYDKFEKAAKDLGLEVPTKYVSKKMDVKSYIKEIKSKIK